MPGVKICRICLVTDVKMYNNDRYNLQQYYGEVMAVNIDVQDGLPQHFCYECASLLHKFHKFKEKCHSAQKVLEKFLLKGPITHKSIVNIDRERNQLKSTLDFILVNKRVRTLLIKSKTLDKSVGTKNMDNKIVKLEDIQEIKLSKIEQFEIDDSDDSLDNKNLADYRIEIMENKNIKNDTQNDVEVMTDDEKQKQINYNIVDNRISDDEQSDPEMVNTVLDENIFQEKIIEKVIEKTDDNKSKSDSVRNKKNSKFKKFEHKAKTYLDPEHWLKIILSEEEAVEEFKARALDVKYLAATYKCTECFKWFSKEDMLNRHKKLRHSESLGPIICRFCNMRFKWKCFLTKHISQHYTKFKCLRCELTCPLENSAIFHNDYHNGVTRKCVHCGQEFRHLSTYYTHLRTHRSEHVCTLCGESFVSVIGLGIHKRTMHVDTVVNPEEEVNTYCERCDVKFETHKAYEEHVFHSAKHIDGIEELTEELLAEPKMNSKGRKRDYRRNPRRSTTCCLCNKNFSAYTAYLKHHAAEHSDAPIPKDNQRHICEICGASLAPGSVVSHLNTHTRDKLHTCQVCGMQFNTKGSMIRHQLTHTGERPYSCSLCGKRFTQRSSMNLHHRTFHLKEPYPKRNRKKAVIQGTVTVKEVEGYLAKETEQNSKIVTWQ